MESREKTPLWPEFSLRPTHTLSRIVPAFNLLGWWAIRSLDAGRPNWDEMRFRALRARQNQIMAFLEVGALGRSPFPTWETLRFVNISKCPLSPVGLRSTIASVCVFLLTF